jgi:hypothetical protein
LANDIRSFKAEIDWDGISVKDCYDKWFSQTPELATLPALLSWHIWMEHNKAIF